MDALLRRRRGRAGPHRRRRGGRARRDLRRAQPRARHRRGRCQRACAARAGEGRRLCERARGWSTPIGAHQAIAHPLARGKIELELARLMTQKAAALIDARAGALAGEASNMAKFAAAEAAVHCVAAAIQTHGGNGVATE
ncbi:MAG: hypothetical protein IPO93_18200 [Actinobacteria bacterium]|nr:hypothetical protein [Actinomycetota bacterium]